MKNQTKAFLISLLSIILGFVVGVMVLQPYRQDMLGWVLVVASMVVIYGITASIKERKC